MEGRGWRRGVEGREGRGIYSSLTIFRSKGSGTADAEFCGLQTKAPGLFSKSLVLLQCYLIIFTEVMAPKLSPKSSGVKATPRLSWPPKA